MQPLEQSLRLLAAKLTGADLGDIPAGEPERVAAYLAEHATAGASLTALALTVDAEGAVTGGSATLSDGSAIPITVTAA